MPGKKGALASKTPPSNKEPGDLWYNISNKEFYYMNEEGNWIATDAHDNVIDIILGEAKDTPEKAYKRAMGVL